MAGILVPLLLATLALLAWPGWWEDVVDLRWQLVDMRSVLHGTQALLAALAAASWFARRRLAGALPSGAKLLRVLFIVGGTTAVMLAAAEVALRALHLPFSGSWVPLEVRLSRFDEELGWEYRPNQTVMRGPIAVHLDAIGARVSEAGYEHDLEAPAVILVGGSFTFGHGVPYEQCFAGRLAAAEDLPFEVVNLGVQAYGTDQALLRLKRHIDRFDTRVVVYTYISAHIQRNANHDRRLLYPQAKFIGTKPMFELTGDGELELVHAPVLFEDLSYSRLGAYARMAWLNLGPPRTEDLTRALVREMQRLCESKGAELIVVDWVQDTPMSLTYGDRRPLEGLDLTVIDPSVGAPPEWNEWKIPNDGHPDARAHERVAGLLAAELRKRLP